MNIDDLDRRMQKLCDVKQFPLEIIDTRSGVWYVIRPSQMDRDLANWLKGWCAALGCTYYSEPLDAHSWYNGHNWEISFHARTID